MPSGKPYSLVKYPNYVSLAKDRVPLVPRKPLIWCWSFLLDAQAEPGGRGTQEKQFFPGGGQVWKDPQHLTLRLEAGVSCFLVFLLWRHLPQVAK